MAALKKFGMCSDDMTLRELLLGSLQPKQSGERNRANVFSNCNNGYLTAVGEPASVRASGSLAAPQRSPARLPDKVDDDRLAELLDAHGLHLRVGGLQRSYQWTAPMVKKFMEELLLTFKCVEEGRAKGGNEGKERFHFLGEVVVSWTQRVNLMVKASPADAQRAVHDKVNAKEERLLQQLSSNNVPCVDVADGQHRITLIMLIAAACLRWAAETGFKQVNGTDVIYYSRDPVGKDPWKSLLAASKLIVQQKDCDGLLRLTPGRFGSPADDEAWMCVMNACFNEVRPKQVCCQSNFRRRSPNDCEV